MGGGAGVGTGCFAHAELSSRLADLQSLNPHPGTRNRHPNASAPKIGDVRGFTQEAGHESGSASPQHVVPTVTKGIALMEVITEIARPCGDGELVGERLPALRPCRRILFVSVFRSFCALAVVWRRLV